MKVIEKVENMMVLRLRPPLIVRPDARSPSLLDYPPAPSGFPPAAQVVVGVVESWRVLERPVRFFFRGSAAAVYAFERYKITRHYARHFVACVASS